MARSPTFDWQRVNPPTHPDLQADDPPHVEQGARLPDPDPLPPPPPKNWRDEPLPPKMRNPPLFKCLTRCHVDCMIQLSD